MALYCSFIAGPAVPYILGRPGSNPPLAPVGDARRRREPPGDQVGEGRPEGRDGACPVADPVLLVVPELGHGAAGAAHDEERIVAEAAPAPQRARDDPLARSLDHHLARL